jgi:hypothetical protein
MPTPDGPQFSKITRTKGRNAGYGAQFGYVSNPHGDVEGVYTGPYAHQYYEYRPNPNDASVHLTVVNEGKKSRTTYPKGFTHDDSWMDRRAEKDGQIPLFVHNETPGVSTAALLEGTKDSRMQAMHVAALADVDTRIREGRGMTPSYSLSPHSQRIVEHLEDKGVTQSPSNISSNQMDFSPDAWEAISSTPDHVFSKDESKVAKGHLRNIVKSSKKGAQAEPEYEQLQLDLG